MTLLILVFCVVNRARAMLSRWTHFCSCRDSITQPPETIPAAHSSLLASLISQHHSQQLDWKVGEAVRSQNTLLFHSLSHTAPATDLKVELQAESRRGNSSWSHLPRAAFGIRLEEAHSRTNRMNIFSIIDTPRFITPCSIWKDSLGKVLRGDYFIGCYWVRIIWQLVGNVWITKAWLERDQETPGEWWARHWFDLTRCIQFPLLKEHSRFVCGMNSNCGAVTQLRALHRTQPWLQAAIHFSKITVCCWISLRNKHWGWTPQLLLLIVTESLH